MEPHGALVRRATFRSMLSTGAICRPAGHSTAWLIALGIGLWSPTARATYSIAACDRSTGACGVAAATHNLAVGSSVPFAFARLGAGVSQLETNPLHARAVERALRKHGDPKRALAEALAADAQFNDGAGPALRQLAVVSFNGGSAAHTGRDAGHWAGHRTLDSLSVQGNGLTGPRVLKAMADTFRRTRGPLAHRLLSALEAGLTAGGQSIGVVSAALIVSHPEGWPLDIDLRVDFAPQTAVADLRQNYDAHRARVLLNRARIAQEKKQTSQATALIQRAVELAPTWDRIWLGAYRLTPPRHTDQRRRFACRFATLNPVWARQMGDDIFSSCGGLRRSSPR